jgi:hypothetical protein
MKLKRWGDSDSFCTYELVDKRTLKNTDPPFRLATAADRCHALVA